VYFLVRGLVALPDLRLGTEAHLSAGKNPTSNIVKDPRFGNNVALCVVWLQ